MSTDRYKVLNKNRREQGRPTYREEQAARYKAAIEAQNTPAPSPVAPGPLPSQYNPANYDQQLASQLSPGYQVPTPGGQYPLPQYPQVQQPGFNNQGFNPNMGLFGSFAPQGGMFGGILGGQQ